MASRKRKKKRKLNIRNLMIIFILIITGVGCFFYIKNLRIKNIYIEGTSYLKDATIIRTADIKDYPKIYELDLNQIKTNLKNNELIKDVKITRNPLGVLKITIEENTPLFYYHAKKSTILSDGTQISSNSYAGLPTIINIVPSQTLTELVNGIQKIDRDIISQISEIEYSEAIGQNGKVIDDSRFILYMNDGHTVHMNTENIKKLSNYFIIYDEIYETYALERGVLKLDSRTDAYTFKTYQAIAKEEEADESTSED